MYSQRTTSIQEGDTVLIRGGTTRILVRITKNSCAKLGRLGVVPLASIIGKENFSAISFDDSKNILDVYDENPQWEESQLSEILSPVFNGSLEPLNDKECSVIENREAQLTRDNRNLNDTSSAQCSSKEKIQLIARERGAAEAAKELARGSTSFETKTEFSQVKYLRRKAKEWANSFVVSRCTLWDLCELGQNNAKMPIRFDVLNYILNQGNVSCDSKVLLYDRSNGLITASILQRVCNGRGMLHEALYTEYPLHQQPKWNAVRQLGLPSTITRNYWHAFSIENIVEVLNQCGVDNTRYTVVNDLSATLKTSEEVLENSDFSNRCALELMVPLHEHRKREREEEFSKSNLLSESVNQCEVKEKDSQYWTRLSPNVAKRVIWETARRVGAIDTSECILITPSECQDSSPVSKSLIDQRCRESLECNPDSLIIVGDGNVMDPFLALFPLLSPGGVFVVYSQCLKPLEELFFFLQDKRLSATSVKDDVNSDRKANKWNVVQCDLVDLFMRFYHFENNSTHPSVQGPCLSSGYVIHGIKVLSR